MEFPWMMANATRPAERTPYHPQASRGKDRLGGQHMRHDVGGAGSGREAVCMFIKTCQDS
jgi:hypothetical protein